MKPVSISYDPRKLDWRAIETFLSRRMIERSALRWASWLPVVAFFAVIFVMGLLMDELGTGPLWLLPPFALFLTFEALRRIACKQVIAERDAAPVRNRPSVTIALDETGVLAEGTKFRWPEIIEVLRGPKVTLLMYLPEMGIVLPDDALPEGLSPESLMARIAEWRLK
jgi:hypothetical protein